MNTVMIHTENPYPVVIGSGALHLLGQYITADQVCVISDSHVWPIYGQAICQILDQSHIRHIHFVFPAGENSKNITTYCEILNFLAENHMTRSSQLIALGGGVVGDLTGFAAATYLRGISYIQVPTTLLAMVDSSVGGKTGIDLPAGKNLCGAFHQPKAVLCDTDTLATLPREIFRDGCAEVIKYGILYDATLFAHLEETGFGFAREWVIRRCIEHKGQTVQQDTLDRGARKFLNFGHTVGHALEQQSDYALSHGKAVAIGMALMCKAVKIPDTHRILSLLEQLQLPVSTDVTPDDIYSAALSDKKRSGDTIDLILPERIGKCQLSTLPLETFQTLIKEGLSYGY